MVRVVQGPGYPKMTIRPKDAAVCGDRVTPNMATYASLFCHYVCKGAMCTKKSLDPGTHNWWYGLYRVLATVKWPSALRTWQFVGDKVTPNMATYAFLFCHYVCKGAMCTKKPLDPGTHNWWYGLYRVLATVKWPSTWRTRQFVGTGSPQTWPHTNLCSAIMYVKELCVPNSPWTQGPITDGTGCTESLLP